MADKKMDASKIDSLYSWISYDLQKLKEELMREMKYSSVQFGSLYKEMQSDKEKSAQAISQEIRYSYKQNQTIYDGLASLFSKEVGEKLKEIDEKVSALENVDAEALSEIVKGKLSELVAGLEESFGEVKYGYMQQQAVYDGLTTLISGEVVAKLDNVEAKLAMLEQIDATLEEINQRAAETITLIEDADYKTLIESVAEKTEECVAEHSRQVIDAVAAIPVAENIDYSRIVDEVGDKVLELLGEVGLNEPAPVVAAPAEPVEAKIDYDRIIYGAAEKVVESLPYPDKVDYRRINDSFVKAAENVQVCVPEEAIVSAVNAAVEKALAALDIDALATKVAEKIQLPVAEVAAPEVDYERLADLVAEKLSANDSRETVLTEEHIDTIAEKVAKAVPQPELPELDYDRVAAIVEEKLANQPDEEATYELVLDEEGIDAIATTVAEKLCVTCGSCEATSPAQEAPVEEVVEEAQEEEPVAEEPVAEPVVEETTASEELAVAEEHSYEEVDNQLVDAETGLVIRLKKSFTAKMKQSEERVKEYYSSIKNELTSYKKINSNVSWHGDRFNYGRDTVAKVNICGKTLCFYLALDPENPEFKTTVYHQKNVGAQKAYENTPFMVKVKSDAAAKKALRLVGYLADKLGTAKKDGFEPVNYTEQFAYETTKQLFDEGLIKATKEKKVELDF